MSEIIINGKKDGALKAYMGGNEIAAMCAGGSRAYTKMVAGSTPTPSTASYLCFEPAGDERVDVSMGMMGSPSFTPELYISGDGENWTRWDLAPTTIYPGSKLYMYGENETFCELRYGQYAYWHFITYAGQIAVSGDVTTLLTQNGTHTLTSEYTFYGLFENCVRMVSAPELPATTLAPSCYGNMFMGCTSLATAPELPATTMAESCYLNMFRNCSSLAAAPALPATALAGYCYGLMFYGCTSLAQVAPLPATTLAAGCYYGMFNGCTSLATAPEIQATAVAGGCFTNMFNNCNSLNYVKIHIATWDTSVSSYWLYNTALSGTIYAPVGSDIASYSGDNGVPSGWTVEYY